MSPIATVCHTHRVLVPVGERCPACVEREAGRQHVRRSARNRELGRTSMHWRRLRARLIAEAEGVCPECGVIETDEDPGSKLTCDLVAGGDHSRALPEDCRVRCRRCHGRAQGGRR